MSEEFAREADVKRLRLEPGDKLLLKSPGFLDLTQAQQMRDAVREWAGPDVPVLIIDERCDLTIFNTREATS